MKWTLKPHITNHSTYDVKSSMVHYIQYVTSYTKDDGYVVMISSTKYNWFNQNCMISKYEGQRILALNVIIY
jgi:hypothetical protein